MSGFGQFSLPLARPWETATGSFDRRDGFLVRLGDDPVGIGEASPLAGWTEGLEACRTALAEQLAAADALASPDDLPDLRATPAARHGLELALYDREARASGEPLYRQLGGDRRVSSVPVNATVPDGDVEATAEACRAAAIAGFPSIKLKVGARPVDDDVERVASARDAVGGRVDLRIDANGAWSRDEATTAIEKLGWLGIASVEQPLDPADLDGHAALRDLGVEIALDESLASHPLEAVLEAKAADVLVLKPMALGGVGRARAAADRARDAGLDVVVSNTVDATVARTAAVHLAAALDVDRPCGLATADRLARDVGPDPATVVDGAISVPQGAGHGVGVEELE